jgi:DNA-binding IclR family transcriptional regulator
VIATAARESQHHSVLHANYHSAMVNIESDQVSVSDIRAVARVAHICALFGPAVQELSAADVAERTGLNRTTAYRYCASMVAAGILEKGSRRGTFALGGMMLELGLQALGRERVLEIAGPYLRTLSTAVEMTVVLSIPGAHGPVVALVAEELSQPVLVTVRVGTKLDVTAAQSHVFLAYESESTMDVMAVGLSPAERARLELDVAAVRKNGYSVSRPSGLPLAAAAPVFDDKGLRATIAFLGVREADDDLSGVLDELVATAAALSDALGASPQDPSRADV